MRKKLEGSLAPKSVTLWLSRDGQPSPIHSAVSWQEGIRLGVKLSTCFLVICKNNKLNIKLHSTHAETDSPNLCLAPASYKLLTIWRSEWAAQSHKHSQSLSLASSNLQGGYLWEHFGWTNLAISFAVRARYAQCWLWGTRWTCVGWF